MISEFSPEKLQEAMRDRPYRYYESVTSTNDIARHWQQEEPNIASGAVVLADQQTGGRGRVGRQWHTPPGQAIAMSVILRPKLDSDQLQRITMLAGVAVVEAISEYLQNAKREKLRLKWPNDVLLAKQKVCGVLTETIWIGNDLAAVVMGIGINVRVQFANTPLAEIATSLEDHTAQTVNRLDLVMKVLERVDDWMEHLHSPLLWEMWRSYLVTIGQPVSFSTAAGKIDGIAVDADKTGALIVQDQDGRRHRVLVGDMS